MARKFNKLEFDDNAVADPLKTGGDGIMQRDEVPGVSKVTNLETCSHAEAVSKILENLGKKICQ